MACETPAALTSERAAELGKHAESSLLAVIRELVGPQRDQLRRATSNMLCCKSRSRGLPNITG
jgi:hypothetical protein